MAEAQSLRLITVPHSGTTFTRELMQSWDLVFSDHHAWETGFPVPWVSTDRIVCTARDPVLVEISAQNRGRWVDFGLWGTLADWRERPNVHFFRVDCPEDERDEEIRKLAEFCGVDVPEDVDWTPKNTSHDRLGLKERYATGEEPHELRHVFRFLRENEDVQALFRDLGYDLPWFT